MKAQIILRPAGGEGDVDVWSVRREQECGSCAAARTAERRARKRQAEQAVRQVVQAS